MSTPRTISFHSLVFQDDTTTSLADGLQTSVNGLEHSRPIKRPSPTPLSGVGKILTFKSPYEDIEELLREFYAEERDSPLSSLVCAWVVAQLVSERCLGPTPR